MFLFFLLLVQITVEDTVGCGDSMAAAMVLGYINGYGMLMKSCTCTRLMVLEDIVCVYELVFNKFAWILSLEPQYLDLEN